MHRREQRLTFEVDNWLSGITIFEGPSVLGLLTTCISPIEQCSGVVGFALSAKIPIYDIGELQYCPNCREDSVKRSEVQ